MMSIDGIFDENYWRLMIDAVTHRVEYYKAMALVFEHEGNREIQYRFLGMAKACEDEIATYRVHVAAMLEVQKGVSQ